MVRVQVQDGVEVRHRPVVFALHHPGDCPGVPGRVVQRFQPYRGVQVAYGLGELAQFPVGHAPVVVEDMVSGVEGDGLVEILQCLARVAHLGVGASPVVVWNRVARLQGDGLVEVCHGTGQVSQFGEARAPAVEGDGIVRFEQDEGVVVLPGQVQLSQVVAGRCPVLQGLGVVRLQLDDPAEVLRRPAVVSQLAVKHPPGQKRVGVFLVGPEQFVQAGQSPQNLLAAQLVQRPGPIAGVVAPIPFTALVTFSAHGFLLGRIHIIMPAWGLMPPGSTPNCKSYQSTLVLSIPPKTVGERVLLAWQQTWGSPSLGLPPDKTGFAGPTGCQFQRRSLRPPRSSGVLVLIGYWTSATGNWHPDGEYRA